MLQRFLEKKLLGSLREFPIVLVTGARQVGKTTLVRAMASSKWPAKYATLDTLATLEAALRDPDGFLSENPAPLIIDEVQKAPDLLRAIKLRVDNNRKPGQYILTGSANIMTLKTVSETLAGRVALLNLYPFSWAELLKKKQPDTLPHLFRTTRPSEFISALPSKSPVPSYKEIKARILAGGYPVPSLMGSKSSRSTWFDGYRQTYLERDVRDITHLGNLPDFNRLLSMSASRTSQLLNYSSMSQDLGLPYTTVRRHLGLLETTYQIFLLRPYYANIGKRLIKSPKLHLTDTGMACHLMGIDSWSVLERQNKVGAIFETWVASELLKLISVSSPGTRLWFWRTVDRKEVDFLIEKGGELIAIQVTWSQKVGRRTIASLHACAEDLGSSVRLALVLYPGDESIALDRRTALIPITAFLGV